MDDFSDVFGKGAAEGEEALTEDLETEEDPEGDAALDAAIDEALTAEDPVIRREAFKNAVRMCKDAY
jgi:hypothetical protein